MKFWSKRGDYHCYVLEAADHELAAELSTAAFLECLPQPGLASKMRQEWGNASEDKEERKFFILRYGK
jgi:hypothetical protein